ncbi:hypothetical protein T265_07662 [Opisthorchis viverrini]|uniref:ferroxidase n=1 Tax=Opisthorchis viverrini TaxID=6198 RepID=A0A074ZGJ6_OPIVI|nr:hypothetical protein T265_07662 [Opisthorchis viverrini]KER24777.1 hypothetical protein T265_07662 [Opisthorchis viverrini]
MVSTLSRFFPLCSRLPVISIRLLGAGMRSRSCLETTTMELSNSEYESLSNETLDKLAEVFDSLGEKYNLDKDYDVEHAYGVLKVYFGAGIGTYIINRQAPNKQLWLSSPRSGPKRYDFIRSRDEWVYRHDGTALHELLAHEISDIVKSTIAFPKR